MAALLLASCFGSKPRLEMVRPALIQGFSYQPGPQYQAWAQEAHFCAALVHKIKPDSVQFDVDSAALDVTTITWIAVPTERLDRTFLGAVSTRGDSMFVWGLTSGGEDTIWMSAPLLEWKNGVKHELMHVLVDSKTEPRWGSHGLPWGFCEYL